MPRLLFLFVAVGALATQSRAASDAAEGNPNTPSIDSVTIGFDNYLKLGAWTRVVVNISSGGAAFAGRVEVSAPDSDGVVATYANAASPIQFAASARQDVTVLIQVGRTDARVAIRLVDENDNILARRSLIVSSNTESGESRAAAIPATGRLMVVLGPPVGLNEAMYDASLGASYAAHVVVLDNATAIPTDAAGLDGVDAVVLSAGVKHSPVATLTVAQRHALLRWVALGGRLVVITSGDAEGLLRPDATLADFLPGTFESAIELRQGRAIEAYCDSQYPIKVRGGRLGIRVPRLSNVDGRIDVFEGNNPDELPLLVRSIRGFGEITYIGFDLAAAPLSDWAGRTVLLRQLFNVITGDEMEFVERAASGLVSVGYRDLSGQLRAALDEFNGVQSAPFALVALLAVLFILMIGPVDYFLVRRVLSNPAMTWITLPAWIVTFSLAAWLLANRFKGHETHANRVEFVDLINTTGLVRGALWTNLFSPRLQTLDLTLKAGRAFEQPIEAAESRLGWAGLPGAALGGMQGSGDESPLATGYEVAPDGQSIRHLPLSKWSTKSLHATWSGETDASLAVDLVADVEGRLAGAIENSLGVPLKQAALFHGRWAWSIGDMDIGAKVDLKSLGEPITARTFLNRRTLLEKRGAMSDEYDATDTNLARIAQRMTWHRHAGGPSAAKLVNQQFARFEFSALVNFHHAILVAVGAGDSASVESNLGPLSTDGDKHLIIHRIVLPVKMKD